jgi:thiamine biosynthesis lipoprotein
VRRWADSAHHIVDPRTGLPADSPWRTVSVAAATCVDANIASTAALVLGAEAERWLAERELPARLVDRYGAVCTTAGWPSELEAAA